MGVPPGRYFRMHMVGYFEGIASERGITWRCSASMSLRDFCDCRAAKGSRSLVVVEDARTASP
jgi:hypothetical protein